MSRPVDHAEVALVLEQFQKAAWREPMELDFDAVRQCLAAHFAAEEGPGGLFELVRRAAPWRAERVDELGLEHASLLAALDFIAYRAAFVSRFELRREIEQYVRTVRAHEIAEGLLFQEAAAEDRPSR